MALRRLVSFCATCGVMFHVAQFGDEVVDVIAFVGPESDAVHCRERFGHQQGGIAFCRTIGLRGAAWKPPVRCGSPSAGGRDRPAPHPLPRLLRASMASGSVVEQWVSLLRFSPWKFTVGFEPSLARCCRWLAGCHRRRESSSVRPMLPAACHPR